mmetsp:Transcript_22070/g.77368  ORF Transcript_22070/g.77368 Transcript_22070/m.77368 type:complete len:367 (+) Transcript_22070:85-1185(+)
MAAGERGARREGAGSAHRAARPHRHAHGAVQLLALRTGGCGATREGTRAAVLRALAVVGLPLFHDVLDERRAVVEAAAAQQHDAPRRQHRDSLLHVLDLVAEVLHLVLLHLDGRDEAVHDAHDPPGHQQDDETALGVLDDQVKRDRRRHNDEVDHVPEVAAVRGGSLGNDQDQLLHYQNEENGQRKVVQAVLPRNDAALLKANVGQQNLAEHGDNVQDDEHEHQQAHRIALHELGELAAPRGGLGVQKVVERVVGLRHGVERVGPRRRRLLALRQLLGMHLHVVARLHRRAARRQLARVVHQTRLDTAATRLGRLLRVGLEGRHGRQMHVACFISEAVKARLLIDVSNRLLPRPLRRDLRHDDGRG